MEFVESCEADIEDMTSNQVGFFFKKLNFKLVIIRLN